MPLCRPPLRTPRPEGASMLACSCRGDSCRTPPPAPTPERPRRIVADRRNGVRLDNRPSPRVCTGPDAPARRLWRGRPISQPSCGRTNLGRAPSAGDRPPSRQGTAADQGTIVYAAVATKLRRHSDTPRRRPGLRPGPPLRRRPPSCPTSTPAQEWPGAPRGSPTTHLQPPGNAPGEPGASWGIVGQRVGNPGAS